MKRRSPVFEFMAFNLLLVGSAGAMSLLFLLLARALRALDLYGSRPAWVVGSVAILVAMWALWRALVLYGNRRR